MEPKEGVFRLDKTSHIRTLDAPQNFARATRSLRPSGFGKSLWLITLAMHNDKAYKDNFQDLFGHLDIGKSPTPLHSSYYVLQLDFSKLITSSKEEFYESMSYCINLALDIFKADTRRCLLRIRKRMYFV